jgi:metal-responsive CopG/Arc/MetJ family transcriptional regulator
MAKLKTLQIHLSEQQVEHLDRRRERYGIRRSEYLRRLVDADREKAELEPDASRGRADLTLARG